MYSTESAGDARALEQALPAAVARWLRNPAAHSEAVTRERVEKVRAQICGVGCEGLLVRMAK